MLIQYLGWNGRAVVIAVVSSQESFRFTFLGPFCVEFAGSPCGFSQGKLVSSHRPKLQRIDNSTFSLCEWEHDWLSFLSMWSHMYLISCTITVGKMHQPLHNAGRKSRSRQQSGINPDRNARKHRELPNQLTGQGK